MSKSEFYYIRGTGGIEQADELDDALQKAKDGGFIWASYTSPEEGDLDPLIDRLNIHPLSIEDCFDEKQIPKIDNFPDYTHVLFNTIEYRNRQLTIGEVNLFLGESFIISVSQPEADRRSPLNDLRAMVELEMDKANEGPSFVMHEILDNIVDQQLDAIEAIEDELNDEEEAMLKDFRDISPPALQRIRRDLVTLRKSLLGEREILVKICRNDSRFIPAEAIYHYSDIYDHLNKFVELTEGNRETLTSLIQMSLALVNNRMSRSSNLTNNSVRRLTFITTIFMPLTLISGIGGMSEYTMMVGPSNWRIAYVLLVAGLTAVGIANYFTLKWMGRNDDKLD